MRKSKKYKEPTPCTLVIVKYTDEGYTSWIEKHTDYEKIKKELRNIYNNKRTAYQFIIKNGINAEIIMDSFIDDRFYL